jgi:hypothetical protein
MILNGNEQNNHSIMIAICQLEVSVNPNLYPNLCAAVRAYPPGPGPVMMHGKRLISSVSLRPGDRLEVTKGTVQYYSNTLISVIIIDFTDHVAVPETVTIIVSQWSRQPTFRDVPTNSVTLWL